MWGQRITRREAEVVLRVLLEPRPLRCLHALSSINSQTLTSSTCNSSTLPTSASREQRSGQKRSSRQCGNSESALQFNLSPFLKSVKLTPLPSQVISLVRKEYACMFRFNNLSSPQSRCQSRMRNLTSGL